MKRKISREGAKARRGDLSRPPTPLRFGVRTFFTRQNYLALVCCLVLTAASLFSSARGAGDDAPAQASSLHRWGAVTLFHGLPSDQVRAVAQDADGMMWFGTDAGLARYDGRRIQTLADDGLGGRRVGVLRADSAGALWVGTD